jgi:DNA-binding NarL/FixJ family response regulator
MEFRTTVLLANAFPLIRNSIKTLLDGTPNLQVIACAKTPEEAVRLADAHQPNVVLVDLDVEQQALTDLITKVAGGQTSSILVMTDDLEDESAIDLLRAGANGVVSRRIEEELLCRSITAIARGEMWMSRKATSQLIESFRMRPIELQPATAAGQQPSSIPTSEAPQTAIPDYGLTPREWDVVRAVGEAMSNKDIAVQLGITEYTVKHHLTSIFNKVGVYSRLELAMRAAHYRLIDTPNVVVA